MIFAIPVSEKTLELCEFIHGGPIPHVIHHPFFIINTEPNLTNPMGVVSAEGLKKASGPVTILKVEE